MSRLAWLVPLLAASLLAACADPAVDASCAELDRISLALASAKMRDRADELRSLDAALVEARSRAAAAYLAAGADSRKRLDAARQKVDGVLGRPAADLVLDSLEQAVESLRSAVERGDDAGIREGKARIAELSDLFAYWAARETDSAKASERKKRNAELIAILESLSVGR